MDKRLAPVAFSAPATFATPAQDGTRRFSGVAYAGGVITDHGWFDRVAFDLATTKFATPAPALLTHNEPIGVVDKATVNGEIRVEGNLFADVDGPAKNVAAMADRGMPWQLSVYIKPGSIEEYKAGAKIKLNGKTFDGPLTVFRNSRVREVSFCALGADDQTNATVFNIGGDAPRTKGAGMDPQFTQEDIDRAVNAEKANTAAEKARADKATADLAQFQTDAAARRKTERTAVLKAHFTTPPKDFNEERDWKPYMEMSDEQFALVTQFFKKPAALDPSLTTEHATGGAGSGDDDKLDTPQKIQAKAEKFIADQKAIGKEVSVADAVSFVCKKAA